MDAFVNDYVASLTNAKNAIIFGIKIGQKLFVHYKNTSGKLQKMQFDLHVEMKSRAQVALSVGKDKIIVSVNCWQKIERRKPDDFPREIEMSGLISVGKKELPQVYEISVL